MTDRQALFFWRGEGRTEVVMENDRLCTFKFKDQSGSLLSLLGHGDRLSRYAQTKLHLCYVFIMRVPLMLPRFIFPCSSPS